jgi:flagellar protein FlaJ
MASEFAVDEDEVSKIVDTMKKKYREEGLAIDEVNTSLKELRGIIAEETYSKIDIESSEDVAEFGSELSRMIGGVYLKLKGIMKPIQASFKELPLTQELGFYLYSANMQYSANQFLALATTAGLVVGFLCFIIGLFIGIALKNIIWATMMPFAFGIFGWILSTIIILRIPKERAVARGSAISMELPFALRHMATELKAGLGLYKTLQAIASTNYGVLSEEFARTINEIEEGTDTSVALKHLALRTQSKPLKTTINHMLRAIRVGGNLSEVMNDIARDVSDDLKNKIQAFSQKMNFFAVIFIFVGIVLPVAIIILGSIRNSPMATTGQNLFKSVPLTIDVLIIIYFVIMPILFILMNYFVYKTQPKM